MRNCTKGFENIVLFSRSLKSILYLGAVVNFRCTIRCCTGLRGQFLPIQVIFVINSVFVLATGFLQLRISSCSVLSFHKFSAVENKSSPNCQVHYSLYGALVLLLTIPVFALRSSITFQRKPMKVVKSRTVKCNVTDRWVSAWTFAPGTLSE